MSDSLSDSRRGALLSWLRTQEGEFELDLASLAPASSDASFRSYFRIATGRAQRPSVIVMDAPPDREDCAPFVKVARYLAGAGVSVPEVLAENIGEGFLILSDLGERTYLSGLD